MDDAGKARALSTADQRDHNTRVRGDHVHVHLDVWPFFLQCLDRAPVLGAHVSNLLQGCAHHSWRSEPDVPDVLLQDAPCMSTRSHAPQHTLAATTPIRKWVEESKCALQLCASPFIGRCT